MSPPPYPNPRNVLTVPRGSVRLMEGPSVPASPSNIILTSADNDDVMHENQALGTEEKHMEAPAVDSPHCDSTASPSAPQVSHTRTSSTPLPCTPAAPTSGVGNQQNGATPQQCEDEDAPDGLRYVGWNVSGGGRETEERAGRNERVPPRRLAELVRSRITSLIGKAEKKPLRHEERLGTRTKLEGKGAGVSESQKMTNGALSFAHDERLLLTAAGETCKRRRQARDHTLREGKGDGSSSGGDGVRLAPSEGGDHGNQGSEAGSSYAETISVVELFGNGRYEVGPDGEVRRRRTRAATWGTKVTSKVRGWCNGVRKVASAPTTPVDASFAASDKSASLLGCINKRVLSRIRSCGGGNRLGHTSGSGSVINGLDVSCCFVSEDTWVHETMEEAREYERRVTAECSMNH